MSGGPRRLCYAVPPRFGWQAELLPAMAALVQERIEPLALHFFGKLNCLECSTALRKGDSGRCLGRGHNSNLYPGRLCREISVRGRRQSDWILIADPQQQKLFASFLNSEHPTGTIAIGAV